MIKKNAYMLLLLSTVLFIPASSILADVKIKEAIKIIGYTPKEKAPSEDLNISKSSANTYETDSINASAESSKSESSNEKSKRELNNKLDAESEKIQSKNENSFAATSKDSYQEMPNTSLKSLNSSH